MVARVSDPASLVELDADEMWDVSRYLRPEITREEFDAIWEQFQIDKAAHYAKTAAN